MSKPTLGRGLNDLLGAQRATGEPAAPPTMDVGLRILVAGAPPESTTPASAPASNMALAASRASLPKEMVMAVLVGADVALLGWTAHYAITHQPVLEWFGITVCILSTLVAAACGCAAILVSRAGE